jgi:hypothetical protein
MASEVIGCTTEMESALYALGIPTVQYMVKAVNITAAYRCEPAVTSSDSYSIGHLTGIVAVYDRNHCDKNSNRYNFYLSARPHFRA